ncbi:heparin lyase I family protein [Chroococcus sp. FPU101]|uniref:heparin lyase I family protein n=1 Tax=Chroococcus sp. FPU101 TaxID=1974212 RepID=UPI001A904BEB|nr:heparin lyase I family protein [Chroococcus sp. FPU101]
MKSTFWLSFGCLFLLSLLGSKMKSANLIKEYNFDQGNYQGIIRQYQDKTCSQNSLYIDNSLFQIVDAPGGRSGKAVKHHILNCDERSELVIKHGTLKVDEEYWIGWSMYLPKNYNKPGKQSYTITQQMGFNNTCWQNVKGTNCNNLIKKSDGSITPKIGSPINALLPSVDGTNLQYDLYDYIKTDPEGRLIFEKKVFTMPAKPEQWQDFVMYLNLSSDPKQARFKLWKNGQLYIDERVRLLPPNVGSLGDWKIGAYNGEPGNGERILYTDALKLGNKNASFNDVSP